MPLKMNDRNQTEVPSSTGQMNLFYAFSSIHRSENSKNHLQHQKFIVA